MHYIHYTPPFPLYLPPFSNSRIIKINRKQMAVYERRRQTHNIRYNNEPSFSSSLLDAVYRSIDETRVRNEAGDFRLHKKKPADEDAESLRRAIMIEKWIDNHSSATSTSTPRHLPSNSGSSTDSSTFSSTETESSASKSTTPKKLVQAPVKLPEIKAKSKSRAQKIYGDLKKVKEPISPGGKIANFLNSIFSPRNTKATTAEERGGGTSVTKSRSVNGKSVNVTKISSVIKSRSVNDTKTSATRSCLSRNQFSRGSNNNSSSSSSNGNKSKRSVRFCPVGVIVDEDSQACGHKSIYGSNELYSSMSSSGAAAAAANAIGSQYIKKNIDSLRVHEVKNTTRREFYYYQKKEKDSDDMSCASSDLFELENIGRAPGSGAYEEDQLPVYGTTSFKVVAGGGIW